jgi:hypothetical protein
VQCEALVHASVGIDSDGDSGTVARSESGFDIEEDYEEAIVGDASGDDEDDSELEDNDTSDEDDTVASGQQQQRSVCPVIDTESARGDPVASAYIDSLSRSSGLRIMEEARARWAYQDHGELGLFSLFITKEFKDRIQKWTNEGLNLRGQPETTDNEFDAYIGLELAMSICPLNTISEFWSERRFLAQHDFSATMSCARFLCIRGRVKFHPLDATSGDGNDPLWHSRILTQHVQAKFAQVAVPYGTSSLDENSVRTKDRTRAKSFIPSKPDKYAI